MRNAVLRAALRATTGAAAASLALLAGMPVAVAVTAAPELLRLASVNSSGDPDLVVAVPPSVAAQVVPASAFRVTQGGQVLQISANRIVDEGLDVHVVLDTAGSPAAVAAEQSAAADLIRALPPQVRTATETSGGLVRTPQPGRTTALQALAAARADPTATTAQTSTTLNSIAAEPSAGRSRVVVLLTRCDAGRATGFPSLVSRLANGRQQLDVVETGSSCAPALAAQARSTGGIAMSSVSDARLAEAMDSLTADLLGQYRLSVRNGQRSAPLDVQMDYAGVQASTTVGPRPGADSRSAAATASPPVIRAATPAASAAGSGGVKVLAGLSALVLLATAAGYVLALRRRTPPLAA